jgi:DNA-directed RNA polymerase specialized sigma24 family protein
VSRLGAYDPGDEAAPETAIAETGEADADQTTMLGLLNGLPDAEKTLLLRKYRDGESIEHLQGQFSLSAGAVKMRLKRARTKLNQLYARAVA